MRLSAQTWHDLDMDRVYDRINTCASPAGEQKLRELLRDPSLHEKEIARRDALIRHFDSDEEKSLRYRRALSEIGNDISRPVSETLIQLESQKKESVLTHVLCALLACFSIAMIFIQPTVGLVVFLAALAVNIPLYFKRRDEIGEYSACYSHIVRSYRASVRILSVDDDEDLDFRKVIREAVRAIRPVTRFGFLVTAGRGLTGGFFNMFLDYVRIFFHADLIRFNSMQKRMLEHKDDILKMYDALGEADAFIAVASYRRSLNEWCRPDLAMSSGSSDAYLRIEGMGHPLLKDPVTNDIEVSAGGVLITGSNASGKSTFLRSVGLCAVLGQSIATVCAKNYRASAFHIISAMSVSDDLISGSSYFMAEIKATKDILDAVRKTEDEGSYPVLCFVDEVLKGTNTIERIAASTEVLKGLTGRRAICFAATHDTELTGMLKGYYENYHFEEEMTDADTHFSYRLLEGPSSTRNAIKLLKIMGYDDEMVSAAEKSARDYEESGRWIPASR